MNYDEIKKMTKENIARAVSSSNGLIVAIEGRIRNEEIMRRIPIKDLLSYGERLAGVAQKNLKIGAFLEGALLDDGEENSATVVEISDELRERVRKLLGEDKS